MSASDSGNARQTGLYIPVMPRSKRSISDILRTYQMEDTKLTMADWTIMLYIAADGNLANFAVESLKQLNRSAGTPAGSGEGKVVVAVQFAIDAPGGQQIPRYIFNECSNGSVKNSLAGYLNAPDNMTEQQALISFLEWAYGEPKCQAKNYALILWGHGPELLLQPPSGQQPPDPCGDPQNGSHALYLTPQELRQALEEGIPEDKDLSIIGFDACSMSEFEVAYEIRDFVDYMVASQEEVPDPSFPYDTLVEMFRKVNDPEKLCHDGVYAYVRAYQDYICNAHTGMKHVTLSAFRLGSCGPLRDAMQYLACALWEGRNDPSLPNLLVEARECSRDFAGGLFVDIFDFCKKLKRLLYLSEPDSSQISNAGVPEPERKRRALRRAWKYKIEKACEKVIEAILEKSGDSKALVLANSSADNRCNGVSVYFPYLTDQQYAQVRQPLVKGGPDTIGKGFSVVLNRAASSLLMCIRRQLIVGIEGYYGNLEFSRDTGWYCFIAKQWTKILVQLAPEDLDFLYSAQQSAVNTCKEYKDVGKCPPCEEEKKEAGENGGNGKEPGLPAAARRQANKKK
jgi:hypothetical protein